MTPGDAVRVLAKASAYDRRTIGEADAAAWYEAIGDLDIADALDAVTRHYQQTTDWLMPAHVRTIAAQLVRERRRATREAREVAAARREAIERGPTRDRSDDIAGLIAQLRHILPPGDPEALKPRGEYWAREYRRYQRQEHAVPNPHYRPGAIAELNAPTPPTTSED